MKKACFLLVLSLFSFSALAASQSEVLAVYNSYNTGDRAADAKLTAAQLISGKSQAEILSIYNSYNTGDRRADAALVAAQVESK